MDKNTNRRKLVTSAMALSLAGVIALGGTLAWQSTNQEALNEKMAEANPGGRLHDDFDGKNKDIYVENFSSVDDGQPIFARVKLVEYMETGKDAGKDVDKTQAERKDLDATPLVTGAEVKDEDTWRIYRPGDLADPFRQYFTLDTKGGSTIYLPTFNRNKDSLTADINGTYESVDDSTGAHYHDYTKYTDGQKVTGTEVVDVDDNDVEEENPIKWDASKTIKENQEAKANIRETADAEHTAKSTINGTVITMADWLALGDDDKLGNFWVWDTDGWAYWANPIEPETATGLLLSEVTPANISEKYYYSITAIAQFCTADDLGEDNKTGFFDSTKGTAPGVNAKKLLDLLEAQ